MRVKFAIRRIGDTLWIKPLLASMLSVAGIFLAKLADRTSLADVVPSVTVESIQSLLSIMASSVLVIASLAVASMVAAYSSASNTASPRAFPLVVADDRSQYALTAFVAAFIYSIIGLIASKNEYFGPAGRFVLFALTLLVLTIVVLTFVTWIDRIARLGRMSVTIEQVEQAARKSMDARAKAPFLGGHPLHTPAKAGMAMYADEVGFLQYIDMAGLQEDAVEKNLRFEISALPGTFITPDREVAYCLGGSALDATAVRKLIRDHFVIGRKRTFVDDPRFGLVVLSQIAGRALSPAVNDPGTAIDVIGVLVRLFVEWNKLREANSDDSVVHDRISVPRLTEQDMFNDAFTALQRDGAGVIEVMVRLLKALETLATTGDPAMRSAAIHHAKRVVELVENKPHLNGDRELLTARSAFARYPVATDS